MHFRDTVYAQGVTYRRMDDLRFVQQAPEKAVGPDLIHGCDTGGRKRMGSNAVGVTATRA